MIDEAKPLDNDRWYLVPSDSGLSLSQRQSDGPKNIRVDFAKPQLKRRGQNELLFKALGVRRRTPYYVIDATAGMGIDAFVLAQAGCQVTLIERATLVAALLEDGIARARQTPAIESIAARMHLEQGDAITLLSRLAREQQPDVIYLDPMFPQRNKSALPKKAMQSLQALVGDDNDQAQLLDAALQVARFRVVVKRNNKVKAIGGLAPSYSLQGKQIRYDVYALKKLA